METIEMEIKWRCFYAVAIAGISLYVGAWVLCIGDIYSMSPSEYAQQAQQIIECSLL